MKTTFLAFFLAASGTIFASSLFMSAEVFTNLPSTAGNLDFQFNPGDVTSPAATATITLFDPAASLNGPAITGDVSGDLTSSLVINNSTSFNDYFVGYTFPSEITFQLAFSGPAVDSPTGSGFGSTFFFSLYDAAGSLFSIDLLDTGGLVVHDYSADGASISVGQLPEPGSVGLVLLGLAAICRHRFLKNSR